MGQLSAAPLTVLGGTLATVHFHLFQRIRQLGVAESGDERFQTRDQR
jgi:hypothetical protein